MSTSFDVSVCSRAVKRFTGSARKSLPGVKPGRLFYSDLRPNEISEARLQRNFRSRRFGFGGRSTLGRRGFLDRGRCGGGLLGRGNRLRRWCRRRDRSGSRCRTLRPFDRFPPCGRFAFRRDCTGTTGFGAGSFLCARCFFCGRPAPDSRRRTLHWCLPSRCGRRRPSPTGSGSAQKGRQHLRMLDARRVMLTQKAGEFAGASPLGKAACTLVTDRAASLEKFGGRFAFI